MRIQYAILSAVFAAGALGATGIINGTSQPLVTQGISPHRSEFISYSLREEAEEADPSKSQHYLPITKWQVNDLQDKNGKPVKRYETMVEIPYMWLDRDLFIRADGQHFSYRIFVNDNEVGFSNDNRTPCEFEISRFVNDGQNTIRFDVYAQSSGSILEGAIPDKREGNISGVYLHSQPKVRIFDYYVQARPDSVGNHGMLTIDVIVSNSYNAPETVTIGYDIYSPANKLQMFDLQEITVGGGDLDTLRFEMQIDNAYKLWAWSPAKPNLFRTMLTLKRDKRIVEYIPFATGFRDSYFEGGKLIFNGYPFRFNAVTYNARPTAKATVTDINLLKKAGVNTICVDYPQPDWFYDLCDRKGFLVIDQANINSDYKTDDRRTGGTPANDPSYLQTFIQRMDAMQNRSKNHPSVVAWSMGGHSGNGYNLYKSYQFLRSVDSLERFGVTYRDLQGEWNADFEFPTVRDGESVISAQRAQSTKTRRR